MTEEHPWPQHLGSLLPEDAWLKDQYEITGFVGEGGSGAVFKGVQHPLERPVAVKVMYPGHHARVRERFLREAQAVAGLRHPNVVTVFDFGLIDEMRPYIVMELLHGHNLAEELQDNGPMAPQRALPLFMECLEALAEAHAKTLVHRDLKPDNLFLSQLGPRREALQILDFGIALFTHDLAGDGEGDNTLPGSPRLTPTGQKVGTPNYLAPEYFESGRVSAAMDIYAMGLVLAELFMGEPVVQSDNFYGCVVRHLTGNLKFPQALMDGPLGPVIRKACARQPEDRYPDAQALLEALETVQASLSQAGQLPITLTTSSPGLVIHADTELSLAIPRPERAAPEGFSLIIPGTFQMGSPEDEPSRNEDETLHEVTLSRAFFLQSCEVTWAQWTDVMGHAPFKDKPKRPARSLSWYDAVAYCNALSTQQGLMPYYFLEGSQGKPGKDFRVQRVIVPDPDADGWRLPTEAEWEYACRAGEEVEQARHGDLSKIAWYDNNARRSPRAVGGLEPNAWGLYDMLGNVWEWVWDRYGDYGPRRARDPMGPSSSPFRVYRGASFSSSASLCRAANRGHSLPDRRFPNVGFRVARNCI